MLKRLLAIAPFIFMLLIISSCGNAQDQNVGTTADTAETVPDENGAPVYDPGLDYEGYEFRLINYDNATENEWTGIPNDLFVEAENGERLNDSVYRRNAATEEALNIKISGLAYTDSRMTDVIKQSVAAGDDVIDAAFPRIYMLSRLVGSDYLYDLNTLGFDFDRVWYNQKSIESLRMYGRLFALSADLTYQDKLSSYVTFFNQKTAADYRLPDFYPLVDTNSWTLDKMIEIGELISEDIDGNDIYDAADRYGIACQNDAVYILLHAGDMDICSPDSGGNILFNLGGQKETNALIKIYDLFLDDRRFFNRQTYKMSMYDAINMFNENRALFLIRPVQSLFMMREMEADFGILPVPKLDENQENYGAAVNPYSATLTCLPVSIRDPERSAEVIQYMSYESYNTVNEPLYEHVLGAKLIRDEISPKMLDIAFDNRKYDIGLIWNFAGISETLITKRDADVSSMVAAQTEKVNSAIQKLADSLNG
ncbi:MAG: hypothetical protein PHZ09_08705 [Eubacteriales bacterium]|jgi:hypothetical protein|nr:hypothetical protein [Eubacteriales bacterium]